MASRPQVQITHKQRDNKDVSTSRVATTGKVDVAIEDMKRIALVVTTN